MKSDKLDEAGRKALKYPGVTGYDKQLVKRIRDGVEVEEWVLQIHVAKKLPKSCMKKEEVVPKEIDGIPTDVIQRGPYKALSVSNPNTIKSHRPVIAGISIGNILISAGTNGWFMENSAWDTETLFFGSNAHVFTPDVRLDCFEPRIIQPGPADGGREVVAGYTWHKKLNAESITDCKVINSYAWFGNALARLFKRKSRIKTYLPEQEKNFIDFAVARPTVPYDTRIIESLYASTQYEFVGFGFGGDENSSLVCRQDPYITRTGWTPYRYDICRHSSIKSGDMLYKTGRTTFKTSNTVISPSIATKVDYGGFSILFDDVILVNKLLEGGDSGSAVFKKIAA